MDWGRDINVTGALLKTKLCYLLRWLDDMDFTNFPTVGLCILALAEAFLRKNLPTSDNLFLVRSNSKILWGIWKYGFDLESIVAQY